MPLNEVTIRTGWVADPWRACVAAACGEQVISIVLGGGGATGLRKVKKRGGTAFVLHPEDATVSFMSRAAIAAGHPDACLPARKIVRFVGLLRPPLPGSSV
jgi:two-component system, chemotaxis family, protein-glutamate methylesterase/glutaminase